MDAVDKSPYMAPDGSIAFNESIVKKLPPAPRRKDKIKCQKIRKAVFPKLWRPAPPQRIPSAVQSNPEKLFPPLPKALPQAVLTVRCV